MKRIITAAAATALMSTAALADKSDRYNDLRLDTSEKAERTFADDPNPTDLERAQRGNDQRFRDEGPSVTFSSRNAARTPGEGYLYGGFGEGNDSR
ncbi:MAG: hypothetical protein AAF744_01310 [Pseudomonadota bacterium]